MADDLFVMFEPKPPQCRATTVTMDNIHRLAEYFGGHESGPNATEVSVNYNADGATLTIKRGAYTPFGGGEKVPAVEIVVHTGEILAEYSFPPAPPELLQAGWNVVPQYTDLRRVWRPIETK